MIRNRLTLSFSKKYSLIFPVLFCFEFLFSLSTNAQDSLTKQSHEWHSLPAGPTGFKIFPFNRKRVNFVTGANIAAYSGVLIGLNAAWYSGYPRSAFHFFNDDAEWLQVDKVGHAYSAYLESRANSEMWRWAGLSDKKRIWIGGLSGVAYQSIIEVLDGFSSEYGFSPGDFTANVLGSALFISQELAWDVQRIQLRYSFHKNHYNQPDLEARANTIFGKTDIERLIKDYNDQTYWLTANIQPFFPKSNLPKWLCISVGYGAEGMFGARSNIARDKSGNITFDRSDIKRYRQWYLSPDIDLSRIKTNKKLLRFLMNVACIFKFPMPALELSNGSIKGHWIYY